MSDFNLKSALLQFRRNTVPFYRDIRDRPTWELLDTFYYFDSFAPDLTQYPEFVYQEEVSETFSDPITGNVGYNFISRLIREKSEGVLFWDGTRQYSTINILYENNTFADNSALWLDDIRIVAKDNLAHLHANGLTKIDLDEDLGNETVYVLSVTSATGQWAGATNVVIDRRLRDPVTGREPWQIFRAIN